MPSTFPVDAKLTGLVMSIRPQGMISDFIAPYVPVMGQSFEYDEISTSDMFTIPDARIGRRSEVNEVVLGATRVSATCAATGFGATIPYEEINNAEGIYDIEAIYAEALTNLLMLSREKRVSEAVFSTGNYNPGAYITLSGTSQWSDHTNSDPVYAILSAIDDLLMRPNTLVIGAQAWTALSTHPKVVEGAKGTGATRGVATTDDLARLLSLDNVFIGQTFGRSSVPGQTATYAQLWGKDCALLYLNPRVQLIAQTTEPTYMVTARWGDRFASPPVDDTNVGLLGARKFKVGEYVKELVLSKACGYLFKAVAA